MINTQLLPLHIYISSFQKKIDEPFPEEMRSRLLKVVDENPEYIFSILEPWPSPSQHPTTQLPWCSCGFCKDMPTDKEKRCCQRNADSCVSRLPVSICI